MHDGRATVLVIDDDPDFRELVRLYIENDRIEVLEAEDCVRGVALLRKIRDRVNVVLLDYWMPNMEPARCAACIRELVRPSTRLLLVTAAVDARKRAAELGLKEWLSKPFDFDTLRSIVNTSRA
jgi:DNA-binding response OmpR family regulator